MRNDALEAIGPDGCGLRIKFERRGDRYGHMISLVEAGDQAVPVLESVEGLPSDDWPASPPLQNLHLQELPGGRRAALLVGMAGRSHWSASIEAAADQAELTFDIACRAGNAGPLGSAYRWLNPAAARRMEVIAGNDHTRIESSDGHITIRPVVTPETPPRTVRWIYRVRVVMTTRP